MTATKQSGGLPERHKAHLSRPSIVKNIITIINNAVQSARCKVQSAYWALLNVREAVLQLLLALFCRVY